MKLPDLNLLVALDILLEEGSAVACGSSTTRWLVAIYHDLLSIMVSD